MLRRFAAAASLVLLSASCVDTKNEARLDVVKIVDRGFITNAPIYIADEEGYFAHEGIKLQYSEPPGSTTQILPLLERGDLDVAAGTLSAGFYSAVAQGARSRMVADRGHVEANSCDYEGVMARRGLFAGAPPTGKELRGKRVSLAATSASTYIADLYLRSIGLTTADIEMVRLSEPVEVQALEAGSVDAIYVKEPYLSKLRAAGHKLIAPGRLYGAGVHHATLTFGPNLTVVHRDIGQRFMKAYLRGIASYAKGLTPRNLDIVSRGSHMRPDDLKGICLPTINPDAALNFPTLLGFQKWLVENKYLSGVLGAEAGTDMTFARLAAKELGIPPTPR